MTITFVSTEQPNDYSILIYKDGVCDWAHIKAKNITEALKRAKRLCPKGGRIVKVEEDDKDDSDS